MIMEENNITKRTAPNSVVALVLGICSIVFSGLLVGLACGIIGLIYANKGLRQYNEEPALYSSSDMLTTGRVTSIIGIVISGLCVVTALLCLLVFGSFFGFLLQTMVDTM